MKTLNIHEAKTQLSKLLEEVNAGESIVIAKAGKPIAKLVPYSGALSKRTAGVLAGEIWEADDAWEVDDELNTQLTDTPLYAEVEAPQSSRVAEGKSSYNAKKKS